MSQVANSEWKQIGCIKFLDSEGTYFADQGIVLFYNKNKSNLADITTNTSISPEFLESVHCSEYVIVNVNNGDVINDVLGQLPCYFSFFDNSWYLSSTLKTIKLATHHDQISRQALFNYFFFHCIPAPHTIYQNIYKLDAGCITTLLSDGTYNSVINYSPEFAQQLNKEQSQYEQDCLDLMHQCVKDIDTNNAGAFLSGGLDSSSVVGMLAKCCPAPSTFSVGFSSPEHDETRYAQITAKHFATQHKVKYLEADEALTAFTKVAQYFEEPFGNSSAMAAYFCATFAKQNGISHLLAGDGGDEIFAGNERYAKQKVFEHFTKQPQFVRSITNLIFNNSLCTKVPILKKVASYVRQARVAMPDRLENYNFIYQLGAENIFTEKFLHSVDQNVPISMRRSRYNACKSNHQVDRQLFLDWKFTLADNDLVKVRKMCELADVEVSFPLLDKRLIDFSCQIPADVKLPENKLRDFFKRACKGFLADETLSKNKHGFGLPFGVWLKEHKPLQDLAMAALESLKQREIVKPSLIEKTQNAHREVHANYYGELIWIMVVLELWLQGNND